MIVAADTRPAMNLPALLAGYVDDVPDVEVLGLCMDSRQLRPGDLFVALRGHDVDGRSYLSQAAAAGASAAIVDGALTSEAHLPSIVIPDLREKLGFLAARFYGEPSRQLHITGVTGTNGKTTVSQMLSQFIRAAGYDCGVIGTLGATLDTRPEDAVNTTPDPISLNKLLAAWAGEAVPFVAMEVSSHALVQGRLRGIEIDSAIFTNLTRDHLDYHGDMAAYGTAKAQLFRSPGLRKAAINVDDPFAATLQAQMAPEVQVLRYGRTASKLDVKISVLEQDSSGLRLRLESDWGKATLRCPLLGTFNALNLAAAVTAGMQAGLPFDSVVATAESLVAVPGRMEPIRSGAAPLVVVDYAHTPDALRQVLRTLRELCTGRLIAVFGCGGDRDVGKRALMAEAVSEAADFAVLTNDNPRSEDPQRILGQIAAAMTGEFEVCEDRATAIERAIKSADKNDCVLVAGKGHEDYQLIGDERLSFSDSDVARRIVARLAA
ncbi:MAG: UDP-N-acetylmuramoyl-L-alanyl-D-glutamate--2,6-diaminopimelate ligase [Congregibacter sp.]